MPTSATSFQQQLGTGGYSRRERAFPRNATDKQHNPLAMLFSVDIFTFNRNYTVAGEFSPMSMFPPLFIGAAVTSESGGGENRESKSENNGRGFHQMSPVDGQNIRHNGAGPLRQSQETLKALPICTAGINPPGSTAVVFSR